MLYHNADDFTAVLLKLGPNSMVGLARLAAHSDQTVSIEFIEHYVYIVHGNPVYYRN